MRNRSMACLWNTAKRWPCTAAHLWLAWSAVWMHGSALAESPPVLPLDDLEKKVAALAQPLIDNDVLVGCAIGLVSSGETRVLAFGEVERGSGVRPTGQTVYEIGSITKVMTGTLLADLAARGVLGIDDRLQPHLPDGVAAPAEDDQEITLANLATHTSGLPRLADNMPRSQPHNPYADYDESLLLEFLSNHELRRSPGDEYEYSNYGAGLLGYVLARAEGKTYEELLVERICNPLEMNDTRITLTPQMRKRLAPPYNAELADDYNWDLNILAGCGGVRSTVDDMLKFAAAALADDDRPVVQALQAAMQHRFGEPGQIGMGLGWHQARDGVTWWHNGQTGGYTSALFVHRQSQFAVVVLANTGASQTTPLGEKIIQTALGMEVEPFDVRKTVEVPEEMLDSYVGKYALSLFFVLDVTLEDGKLMVQATGQDKYQVFPESETEFFYKVVDAQLTFERGEDGAVKRVILHQNGCDVPGLRVPEVEAESD